MTYQSNDRLMGVYCRECYSTNHGGKQCPYVRPEDDDGDQTRH